MSASKDHNLLDSYLDDLDKQGRSWSVYSYRNKLRHFLGWLDKEKLALPQVAQRDVERYLAGKKHKDRWNYHSLVQLLSVLRCFFRYLLDRCLVATNPTEGVACAWLDVEGGWENAPLWLKETFRYPFDARRYLIPFLSPHLENYILLLKSKGYSKKHIGQNLDATRQFCGFLKRFKLANVGQITTGHHEAFLHYINFRFQQRRRRPAPKEYIQAWRSMSQRFLQFAFKEMGRRFLPTNPERVTQSLPPSLLGDYLEFCQVHRGLKEVTWRGYQEYLLRLGVFLDRQGIRGAREIKISDLDAFLMEQASRLSRRSLRCIGSALRSFFGYLFLQNEIQNNPADHLIFPSRFRDDLRPKYIPWPRVQAFLAGINRSVATGKRDYTVLVLLAAYGLRIIADKLILES
ncbi:MAG: site-specific integrase [Elusimicrobia bacterium]|nr:site-specific integrase [Elusimicrobiota bacterium]